MLRCLAEPDEDEVRDGLPLAVPLDVPVEELARRCRLFREDRIDGRSERDAQMKTVEPEKL